jgi:leucyl-tRNA synthetase
MLRITKYAERLLTDLDGLDWPEPIKLMQRNWIGRSTGAEVLFPLAHKWRIESGLWVHAERPDLGSRDLNYQTFPDAIRVYTTRPDTLFGATYMVLAPEHELVDRITAPQQRKEVETYVEQARRRSELERTAETKAKTGVFTGAYAINPVNGWKIPVWVADYVLMGYGTGAIMAVPGGDTRDFEFACKFDLPIVCVVGPTVEWIEERLSVMVTGIEKTAAAGLDEVARQFPEWGAEVARRRERSAGLDQKTIGVLRGHVGVDRLIEHYIEHPKSWGDAFTGEGTAVHSPGGGKVAGLPGGVCALDGLPTAQAKAKIIAWLEANGLGRGAVNYKMRDWVFSRQKYWGEPFPILHGEGGETIPLDDELPVTLPEMEDFKPAPAGDDPDAMPAPPLSRATDWVNVARSKDRYRRDVNTMPQWAGSCWYYLRFIDPHNPDLFCNPDAERYWMPVDLYVGGAEHAVLHLLYARFWHKVLYDLGHVSTSEPFRRLFNQGMIQGFAYRDRRGLTVYADDVEAREGETFVRRGTDEPVARVIAKMSKSLKNVVNPDEIIGQYGADTFRLYEMFMGPLDASKPWNTRDVPGLFKLCQRVWRLIVDEETNELSATLTRDEPDDETLRMLHKTIQRVTEDIEQLKFNTAIAAIFDFVNFLTPKPKRPRAVIEPFVLIVSPFAPHLGEELWHRLGHEATLAYEPWPVFDERLARDEEVEIAVQITGKVKARIMVPADADARAVEAAALANDRVQGLISGKQIRKVIVVPKRLVNIITN